MADNSVQFADDVTNPFAGGTPQQAPTTPSKNVQFAEDTSNPFDSGSAAAAKTDEGSLLDKVASAPNNIPLDSYAHATERGLANIGQGAAQAVQATGQLIKGAAKSLNPFSTPEARTQAATELVGNVAKPISQLPSQAVALAKNPPSLKDIGDVAGQTAGNVVAGEAMGEGVRAAAKGVKAGVTPSETKVAAPIKATVPEAALQPDKAVAASDKLYQAVAPTKTDAGFRANVHVAAGDLAQAADKVKWDEARGGKGMTRGSAPPDMRVRAARDAVNERMGEMYQAEVEPKINAVQSTPANLAPNPEAYKFLAQTAGDEATRNLAAKAAAHPEQVTVAEAYQLAKTVNAELNNFERLDPAQQYQVRATNPGINKLNGLDETLNKTINDSLQRRGLPGIQNFERRYAAMAAVRRNLAGRMNEVELRRQGLMDRTVGKVAKAAMGRNVNAIASASAASLADVNVGDFVEKAFKDLKASGVKPQLDAQPPAPKLTLKPPVGRVPGPRQEALGGTGMASSRSAAPEGVGDVHTVPGPPNLELKPSGQAPAAAQRPFSFMENENPNQSGPVYPGGKGVAAAPKTSGGTSVLSGEKPAPKTSSASSSSPQSAVEAGGGKFLGHNEVGTWFNEPKSGSTLLIEKGKPVTAEAVKAKIAATQDKFNTKAATAPAGKAVEGAPNRFLKLMGADEDSVVKTAQDESTVKHFQQKIKNGEKIPEPTLTVDKNNSIISGDGRHRLIALQREGVPSVKVIVKKTGEESTGPQIIGKRTAKPRTPGEPLQLGFNMSDAEDLLSKVRSTKPGLMRGLSTKK